MLMLWSADEFGGALTSSRWKGTNHAPRVPGPPTKPGKLLGLAGFACHSASARSLQSRTQRHQAQAQQQPAGAGCKRIGCAFSRAFTAVNPH